MVSDSLRKAGAWGTFVHRWKETGCIPEDDSEFSDSFVKTFNKKWGNVGTDELRETLWPISGRHEVSYSFNCDTGEVGTYHSPGNDSSDVWKNGFPSQYVTGTNDYEGEIDGLPWVDDLKTGAMFDTPPDRSLQLYFYAMCSSLHRYGELRDSVVSITRWPKYPLTATPDRKFGYLSTAKLEKFRELLISRYWDWWDYSHPNVSASAFEAGDWCQWCAVGESGKCPIS